MAQEGGFRRGGFRPHGGGNRSGGSGGFSRFSDRGPREMHKIKCSDCGKDAEVPFQPRQGTPVYCRECFFKRKGMTDNTSSKPSKKEKEAEESEESEKSEEDNVEEE